MRINNINSASSFGKVYACAGTKEQLGKLKNNIKKSEGYEMFLSATDLYVRKFGKWGD